MMKDIKCPRGCSALHMLCERQFEERDADQGELKLFLPPMSTVKIIELELSAFVSVNECSMFDL